MGYKRDLITRLETIFGCGDYLNEVQKQAIKHIFKGEGDIFVSGYGKSLCYQLPVMVKDNSFIIVITARVSYMKKYSNYFTSKQITTNYLTANTSRNQKNLIQKDITSNKSKIKLLFITPVQYETAYFKTILKKIDKQRLLGIVIDQTDNIISKQENLRNQYQNLDLKIICVPIIALISTANAKIQRDVMKNFKLKNPVVYTMPVHRANLHCDVKFINLLDHPMKCLTRFIKKCLYPDNCTHPTKEENWGLIVCKDLEAMTTVAHYFESKKILVMSSDSLAGLNQGRRTKETNLQNIEDMRVILVCEKNDILSVTNSLVQKMAPKQLKLFIYWRVVPNIEKYCLLSNRVSCVYKTSYYRVYPEINEVIDNCIKSFNDINSELSTVILNCLEKMQCRHKTYSHFFGEKFTACGTHCDVCVIRKNVEEKIKKLMAMIDNLKLRGKLEEILTFSKDSNKICNRNVQYKSSHKKISSHKTESTVKLRIEKENKDDHSSSDKYFAYSNEVICEPRVEIDKKANALSELRNVYAINPKTMPRQTSTSTATRSSTVDTRDKQKTMPRQTSTSTATRSSTVYTGDKQKTNAEASETCQWVIPISDKYLCKKSLTNERKISNKSAVTQSSNVGTVEKKRKISKQSLSSKTFNSNNEKYKSNSKSSQISEVITLDDDDDDDDDDDVTIIKEVNNKLITKRPRSIDEDQESIKEAKRPKYHTVD